MIRSQRMRGPNLLERLNKGIIINTMKHFMMMVLYSYVARKQYFAGRPQVEAVVAREGGCRTWSCFLQFWSQSHK